MCVCVRFVVQGLVCIFVFLHLFRSLWFCAVSLGGFCFFSTELRDWLGRTSPKWRISRRVGRKSSFHPSSSCKSTSANYYCLVPWGFLSEQMQKESHLTQTCTGSPITIAVKTELMVCLYAVVAGPEGLWSLHCVRKPPVFPLEQPVLSAWRLRRAVPREVSNVYKLINSELPWLW